MAVNDPITTIRRAGTGGHWHALKLLGQDRESIVFFDRTHGRILRSIEQVGRAMVSAYCQMQEHLISQYGIAIGNADPMNFLLDGGQVLTRVRDFR